MKHLAQFFFQGDRPRQYHRDNIEKKLRTQNIKPLIINILRVN
tara:strand:+ start:96062 stop:96190 length:129 start_codon:yes stop_codon:yes gene_type:complete